MCIFFHHKVRIGMIVEGYRRWQHKSNIKGALIVDDQTRKNRRLVFKSGVDRIFARSVRNKLLAARHFVAEEKPIQILRSDDMRNRWEIRSDDSGATSVMMNEKKESFRRDDIALLAHDYDIRVDAGKLIIL